MALSLINNFNLLNSYHFYKKYHNNNINRLIHITCIPFLIFSFLVFTSKMFFIPLIGLPVNLSFIILNGYLFMYMNINKNIFNNMVILLYFMWIGAYMFYVKIQYSIYYALLMNLFGWISQFIGHYYFEGNRPALMDSLSQAFITAPLFVYLEILELSGIQYDFYNRDSDSDNEDYPIY